MPDGGYWMPLFVHLAEGATLDDDLRDRIKRTIREQLSPRHVPDEIIEVPGVPHTLTGKRIEVPVKRLLQGTALDKAVNPGSVDNLELLRFYEELARAAPPTPRSMPAGADRRALTTASLLPLSDPPITLSDK